jgi:glycosyltransferase involved in cell wall biosynthesis
MLHVIFLSPHSDPEAELGEPDSGGQCIYEHQLATAISGLPDFKVTTFCRQTMKRPDVSLVNNSYSIIRISCGPDTVVPKEELEPFLPEFSRKVLDQLSLLPSDDVVIAHAHYWDGGYAALYLKTLVPHKLPLVWTPHSLGSTKRRKFVGEGNEFHYNFIPRQTWENYTTTLADAVIVSTEKEKDELLYNYAVDPNKVQVVPPGIEFTTLHKKSQKKMRHKYHLPESGTLLLCLGRIVPAKGYHHALEALAEFKKNYQEPVFLAVFGGSTHPTAKEEMDYRAFLESKVEEYGLKSSVFFRPSVSHEKVHEVFSAGDIYLMTSEHEPFGLVTIEAMAMKLPVIAANSGGSLNLIIHNQRGILVNYSQPQRVASYILSLIKDADLYSKITEAGYKFVKRDFDWYQKSARFAQVYRQVSRYSPDEEFQQRVKDTFFLRHYFER